MSKPLRVGSACGGRGAIAGAATPSRRSASFTSSCTSYEQINPATVDGIKTFKRISGCPITITGGTETGHASGTYSHWNGYTVDVPLTTCVGNYITSHYAYAGTRGDGARLYKSPSGNVYARESNHGDILYYTCGC